MAQLGLKNDIPLHVDACLGGFILPFVKKLGYNIPKFDFEVDGVTSVSADIHKYGYASKGVSVVTYKNKALRKFQYYRGICNLLHEILARQRKQYANCVSSSCTVRGNISPVMV